LDDRRRAALIIGTVGTVVAFRSAPAMQKSWCPWRKTGEVTLVLSSGAGISANSGPLQIVQGTIKLVGGTAIGDTAARAHRC
jgi:hypothetical protein